MADKFMTEPLTKLKEAIVADGVVDAQEVAGMRKRLFADGQIDREEADFLFAVNDAVSGAKNDPAWKALFVEALTAHVLKDATSPGVLDEAEGDYLISKIEADGSVDPLELELLANVCAEAKNTSQRFQEFTLAALKKAVLEDGVVDEQEVRMIRQVIYGRGGAGGQRVAREEADLIFDLNDATTGKANHAAWKDLFVEAVTSHLLEDEASPGVVDEPEADWLIGRIEGDQQIDENEKALLANLRSKAKGMPDRLKQLLQSR